MSRIAIIALVAASLAAPAIASGTLTVTVSDRGTNGTISPEAERIIASITAADD